MSGQSVSAMTTPTSSWIGLFRDVLSNKAEFRRLVVLVVVTVAVMGVVVGGVLCAVLLLSGGSVTAWSLAVAGVSGVGSLVRAMRRQRPR